MMPPRRVLRLASRGGSMDMESGNGIRLEAAEESRCNRLFNVSSDRLTVRRIRVQGACDAAPAHARQFAAPLFLAGPLSRD